MKHRKDSRGIFQRGGSINSELTWSETLSFQFQNSWFELVQMTLSMSTLSCAHAWWLVKVIAIALQKNYFCFNMIVLRKKGQTATSDSGFLQVNLPASRLGSHSQLPWLLTQSLSYLSLWNGKPRVSLISGFTYSELSQNPLSGIPLWKPHWCVHPVILWKPDTPPSLPMARYLRSIVVGYSRLRIGTCFLIKTTDEL